MAKFNRAAFLSAATGLLEDIVPSGTLDLGDIPIRELTAAQRIEATEVAKVYDAEGNEATGPDGTVKIDTARYWAAIIQMAVLDPATCYDASGAFVEGQGTLLLTPDDILDLAERGKEALRVLAQRIMNLSWMTREDLFRRRPQTDDRQPAAGEDTDTAGSGDDAQGAGDGNDGSVLGDGPSGEQADDAAGHAQPDVEPRVHAGKGPRRRE